jgi:Flp pilus assembly protein TadG
MITVETAICLGGVLIVLALVLAGLSALLGQIQCTDAAREAARLVARGETEHARQVAARIAPSGSTVTITVTGDTVAVLVAAHPVGDVLPGVTMHAEADAVREPQPPDDPTATTTPTAKGNG